MMQPDEPLLSVILSEAKNLCNLLVAPECIDPSLRSRMTNSFVKQCQAHAGIKMDFTSDQTPSFFPGSKCRRGRQRACSARYNDSCSGNHDQ
jgi:hypothetical protein